MRSACFAMAASLPFLGLVPAAADAQQTALQVMLQAPLDTRHTPVGSPVVASVLAPWEGPNCQLKVGATVSGHVLAVQSLKATQREANLALVFDAADCNDLHNVPLPLSVIAIVRTELTEPERQASFYPGLFASGTRAGTAFSGIGTITPERKAKATGPKSIVPGEVVGLKKLSLDVGGGPNGSSILRSTAHDFDLDTRVEFILASPVPDDHHDSPPTEVANAAPAPPPPPRDDPPPDPTEICSAADCILADADTPSIVSSGARLATSLAGFGYHPRTAIRHDFDHDNTVTYLSADQVLVTFDSHRLRSRNTANWPAIERRPIRAVLLNPQTGAIRRVLEWTVEGSGPYLWAAGPGFVLVHMAGSLQLLGLDLKPRLSIPLNGDLAWVAASPSGEHIALALQHERHTREIHSMIQERTDHDPEEDLEIRLIDRNGTVVYTRAATSHMLPPLLTDDGGEIIVRHDRARRWLIQQEGAGTGAHTVTSVNSSCEPDVSALGNDALFVVGCDGSDHWYRAIRSSGHTMLLGRSSSTQMEQSALAGGSDAYAVRIVQSTLPVHGLVYSSNEAEHEQVSVYRAADGKRLITARTDGFPESTRNFALSPDGRQLALLTRSYVEFYPVTSSGPESPPSAETAAGPSPRASASAHQP